MLFFAQWVQNGANITGEANNDQFGWSVSMNDNGSIVAVGANGNDGSGTGAGHVRVFSLNSGIWSQLGGDINGEAAGDNSGIAINLNSNGNIVAIGANLNDGNGVDSGHVRIYSRNVSGVWVQLGGDIDGEAAGDKSGSSISLNATGGIVAISAIENDGGGTNSGHVRVFQYVANNWVQLGQDINGVGSYKYLGEAVALNDAGDILAVGQSSGGVNGANSGRVAIYQNVSGTWTQIGSDINGSQAGESLGTALSFNATGDVIAIGGELADNNGTDSGVTKIYQNISGTWTQIGATITGQAAGNLSGCSVSLNSTGDILAIGANRNNSNGVNAGRTRVFKNISGTWTQLENNIDGLQANTYSGWSVNLNSDGSKLAVGAPFNGSGNVRVFTSTTLSANDFQLNGKSISLYPNPTNGLFQLETEVGFDSVEIYSLQGQLIKLFSNQNQYNVSDLSKGIYLVKINAEEGSLNKTLIID